MGVPVVYTDFDGVLNAFPDDKVLRRGGVGHTGWMKADDPRKPLYDAARAFRLDGNRQARTPGRTFPHPLVHRTGRRHARAGRVGPRRTGLAVHMAAVLREHVGPDARLGPVGRP